MLLNSSILTILLALIGGIIPALIWLYFWNREVKNDPEPRTMILLAFLAGVIAVFISLYFERIAYVNGKSFLASFGFLNPLLVWLQSTAAKSGVVLDRLILVAIFAPFIEELSKFFMAFLFALRSKKDRRPIDPIIYMITTALGFAAVENALFLIEPLSKSDFIYTLITQNMRFIGATLLHTVSSATVGFFIGFNFFDRKLAEIGWTSVGLLCAIIMHAIFNYLMLGSNQSSFIALEIIWFAVIVILLAFERIKRIRVEKINQN
jgi:RsiW-degrading membrane proteinase PrsW (M82 family)